MAQLARGNEEREQKLLWHGVACLRITQYRADEVHWVLNAGGSVGGVRDLLRLGHLLRLEDFRSLVAYWGNCGLMSAVLWSLVICWRRCGFRGTVSVVHHPNRRCSIVRQALGVALLPDGHQRCAGKMRRGG